MQTKAVFSRYLILLICIAAIMSCRDKGGYFTYIELDVLDENSGQPQENTRVALINIEPSLSGARKEELLQVYDSDQNGKIEIAYISTKGLIYHLHVYAIVSEDESDEVIETSCIFSRRINEGEKYTNTFYVIPGDETFAFDFENLTERENLDRVQMNIRKNSCGENIYIFDSEKEGILQNEIKLYSNTEYTLNLMGFFSGSAVWGKSYSIIIPEGGYFFEP